MIRKNRIGIIALVTGLVMAGCTAAAANEDKETIGIIGAMDEEISFLKQSTRIDRTVTIASMEFCQGTIGNKKVVIVKCGMGKVNAGICAHTLINDFGCTKIINTGVAGSLDSRLEIGDIVVSTDAVQHDFTVEAIGFQKGEIPYTGLYAFPADEDLRAEVIEVSKKLDLGVGIYEGRVCSGDQFISTAEQKERIVNDFGGMCCEMEGAAVAQSCYLNDTPFVIIRAISDKPDGSGAVDFDTFKAEAAQRCANIVKALIERMSTR